MSLLSGVQETARTVMLEEIRSIPSNYNHLRQRLAARPRWKRHELLVDFYAPCRHYADHLVPVWEGLDPDERGVFYARKEGYTRAVELGVEGSRLWRGTPWPSRRPLVVAGWTLIRAALHRRLVWMSHGAGQCYDGVPATLLRLVDERRTPPDIRLMLGPGHGWVDAARRLLPKTPVVAVGAPKLDGWIKARHEPRKGGPVVAVGWHFDWDKRPETRTALFHYLCALPTLAERWTLLGHGHPTAWRFLETLYQGLGIEPVRHFDEVLARADLYIADNTSTLYEFASTGRPVVVCDAPWYRRDVHHGGRFWEWADVGVRVSDPSELPAAVEKALTDPEDVREIRERIVGDVYAVRDGTSTQRAVEAIREAAAAGAFAGSRGSPRIRGR